MDDLWQIGISLAKQECPICHNDNGKDIRYMDNLDSIYTDIVMEHSTATYNKHKIENATDKEHGHNPSCGDDITLEIIMEGDIIKDLAFTGHGCAISQASTSIMIDLFKGKSPNNEESSNKEKSSNKDESLNIE